jgi:hypothetical protein
VVQGIVDDVFDRGLVLLVRLDHLRPVAAAEDVILALVALVEGPGVATVQVPHSLVEVRQRGLDEQVVVVPHQAAHVSAPAVAPFDPAQDMEEDDPVAIVHHDRRVVVATDADVVVRAGLEVTEGASHRSKVAPRKPVIRVVTLSLHHRVGPVTCQARDWGGRGIDTKDVSRRAVLARG